MGRISMPQGKGSQLHNRRDYEKIGKSIPDNIDRSRTSQNIVLVDKDIKQAYQEIFGEALKKYNAKQKRADRKIESYYDYIQKSKNGEKLFYEDVVQWGSKDDFESPQTREKAKDALVQYVMRFEQRNPNLRLIGAYIHMDEASPHLHLDYIPVAHGYSRGLDTRNSLNKALKQMGYQLENESRKNNPMKLWKESERAVFGEICQDLGLEVEPERTSTRKKLTVEEYKDARDEMIGELEKDRDAIISSLDRLEDLETQINEDIYDLEDKKDRIESDVVYLENELISTKEQKSVLESQINTLTAKKDALRDQRNELASEKGHLEAQTEALAAEIDNQQASLSALNIGLKNLKQEHEAILTEIKPLQELKTGINKIADTGTTVFGVVTIKKKDFELIKDQAKAYVANRDEIETLRERFSAVTQREERAALREKELDKRNSELTNKENQIDHLYNRQLHLNELLEKAEQEKKDQDKQITRLKIEKEEMKYDKDQQIKALKDKNFSLRSEIDSLKVKIGSLMTQINQIKADFHEKLKGAYQSLTNVAKAIGLLKYSNDDSYRLKELTKKQECLIDGVAKYSADWAKDEGFPEMAEDIEKNIGISQGLQKYIEPPAKKRSRDYDDRSL